jgi:hypothetical protein
MNRLTLLVSNKYIDQIFELIREPLFWIFAGLCVFGVVFSFLSKDDDDDPNRR